MKKTVLTLALSLFAAVPAFAESIDGVQAAGLYHSLADSARRAGANASESRRQADGQVATNSFSAGVYCTATKTTEEVVGCSVQGVPAQEDKVVGIVKALGDIGAFFGKPVQVEGGTVRELSINNVNCARVTQFLSDVRPVASSITYYCTVSR